MENTSDVTLYNGALYNETVDEILYGFEITPENIVLSIVLIVLDIVTIMGNILVLISFYYEPKLRSLSFNYYIFNLAITDFLVAVTAMTFYTIDTLLGYWPFGVTMCSVWIFFDFAMTFASVFTVVAISVDRFWCVTWAHHYRTHNTKRKTVIILIIVWICVFVIWTPPFLVDRLRQVDPYRCIWEPSDNRDFVVVIAVIGHYVPCAMMIGCYIKVFLAMRKRAKVSTARHQFVSSASSSANPNRTEIRDMSSHVNSTGSGNGPSVVSGHLTADSARNSTTTTNNSASTINREKRAFIALTYILASYLICWFPFYVTFDMYAWRPDLVLDKLYVFWFWMTYVNSTINPVLYAFSSKEFRVAFKKVLTCKPGR